MKNGVRAFCWPSCLSIRTPCGQAANGRGEFASWLERDYYAGEWQGSGGDEWHMEKNASADYDRMDRTLTTRLRWIEPR